MTLERTVDPVLNFLTDARVWDHLRVDTTGGSPDEPEDAALIRIYRDAVEQHLDGDRGVLGRAMISQTWELRMDCFPQHYDRFYNDMRLWMPLPPLISVDSIVYTDADGVEQTWAAANYTVLANGTQSGAVVPAYGVTWPGTRAVPDAVTVTFTAGYGDDADDVPDPIIAAGLLMLEDLYANRSAKEVGSTVAENPAVAALLQPHRILGIG